MVVAVAAVTSNARYAWVTVAVGVQVTVRRTHDVVRAAAVSDAMSPDTPRRRRVFVVDDAARTHTSAV